MNLVRLPSGLVMNAANLDEVSLSTEDESVSYSYAGSQRCYTLRGANAVAFRRWVEKNSTAVTDALEVP